jgi:glucose-1-phosphate thymidylyltransferase
MKAVVLAAGYATRLYPLTENQPKPLLKVGGKAIIEWILDKVCLIEDIDEIFIVTNDRFYNNFAEWERTISYSKKIKIINDGTLSNEDRLGAVGDINFVLQKENIDDDLLVIAGDNLFGFSLSEFIDFRKNNSKSIVAFRDLQDFDKVKGRFGVGILEGTKVVDFEEKPMEPRSSLASTACYVFNKEDLRLIGKLLEEGSADNPGDLVKFLVSNSEVHGFTFTDHWFDVGTHESLREADEAYQNEN